MENLLIELMNCGIFIYQDGREFVISKTPTPADSRVSIADTDKVTFPEFSLALDYAKETIEWDDNKPTVEQVIDRSWNVQLMYKHRGLGNKIVDLGEVGSVPYPIAKQEAEQLASRYIIESFEEGDIKQWEVKVLPQSKKSISKPSKPIRT